MGLSKQHKKGKNDLEILFGDFNVKIKNIELLLEVFQHHRNFLFTEQSKILSSGLKTSNTSIQHKKGWYENPKYPLKVYLDYINSNGFFENSIDINDKKFWKTNLNDLPFANSNFTYYINSSYFFHSELEMQVPSNKLSEITKSFEYFKTEDKESQEKLGFKIERFNWELINSTISNEYFDLETNVNIIFYNILSIINIYYKTNRIDEAIELSEFALNLVEERELEYSLGIILLEKNELIESLIHFEKSCQLSLKEKNDIPKTYLNNFMMVGIKANRENDVKKFLKNTSILSFSEESFEKIRIGNSLNNLLDEDQKNSLIYLFEILLSEILDPDLTVKTKRMEKIMKFIDWKGDFSKEQKKLLVRSKNLGALFEKIDKVLVYFKSLKKLNDTIKNCIIILIQDFFKEKTEHGMIVNNYGSEVIIMHTFSQSTNINYNNKNLENIFNKDGVDFEYFEKSWGLR